MAIKKFDGFSNEDLNALKNLHATPVMVDLPETKMKEIHEFTKEELVDMINMMTEDKNEMLKNREHALATIEEFKITAPDLYKEMNMENSDAFAIPLDLINHFEESIAEFQKELAKRT